MATALNRVLPETPQAEMAAAVAADDVPEILYIMGTGRSGTTILEILLANNPGFAGVGEVKHIFRDAFVRDQLCACGKAGSECDLWSSVRQANAWQHSDCERLAAEIAAFESHGRFPALLVGLPGKHVQRYASANRALFAAVGATKRCRVVVDSSKYAGRALLLARFFPNKVKVLCITRSAGGIIRAFRKKNDAEQRPKGLFAVAAYYLYVLWCMRAVKARLKDRCYAIRFEDLNRDPVAVLSGIEAWSGYSFAATKSRIEKGELFDVGHIVTGNRLRKAGRVKFEPSAEKTSQQRTFGEKWLAPVLERYRKLMGF